MDTLTWGALALTLTLLGGVWTWVAFRRRGTAAGLRGAAWTTLPAAAWLTGTLELATDVAGSVADWATHLVFSPLVWAGIVLAGVSVMLFGVSGAMRARGVGTREPRRSLPQAGPAPRASRRASADPEPVDPELDEIEALLRRRGIT